MEKFTRLELKEMLLETIAIYKKLQFSYSHEYSTEPDATLKMFTASDSRKMDEIIAKLDIAK